MPDQRAGLSYLREGVIVSRWLLWLNVWSGVVAIIVKSAVR